MKVVEAVMVSVVVKVGAVHNGSFDQRETNRRKAIVVSLLNLVK